MTTPAVTPNASADGMMGNSDPDTVTLPQQGGDQQVADGVGKAPTPTAPAPTANPHLNMVDHILDVLGAKPKPTYQVDPKTGAMVQGPPAPMTTKQRTGMVLAAALTGFAASEAQPGRKTPASTIATGAGAVLNQDQQDDKEARGNAQADFQRGRQLTADQQEQQLRQAQIYETNQRTALLTRQAENADLEVKQHYIDQSSPIIEKARDETVNGVSALRREHLTQSQLLEEHSQDGARHATSFHYVPDGQVPVIDPKTGKQAKNADGTARTELTFAEIDPNTTIEMDEDQLATAYKNGLAIPGYSPYVSDGAKFQMPIGAAVQVSQFNQGVKNFEHLTNNMNDILGLDGDKALDADQIIKNNPSVGTAFSKMGGHWDGRPSTFTQALGDMGKDPKLAPYARTIATALGGDKLDELNEAVGARAAATKAGAEEGAREPYVEAKENRNAIRQEARADKKAHEHDSDLVITGRPDDTSGESQVMKKGDVPEGWSYYGLDKNGASTLSATIRRTNDVQQKLNTLAKFVQGGGMDHIQAGLVGDAIDEVNSEFKVGAFGSQLPTARINALLNNENYKAMNQASRDFVRLYGFAREAMTQLPALQSFGKSNRMTEVQLRAALALLPDHRMAGNSKAAQKQMEDLQDVIDPLRKLPKGLPGATLLPSWRENTAQPGSGNTPAASGGGAGATPDPFAAFGGVSRNKAAQPQQQ